MRHHDAEYWARCFGNRTRNHYGVGKHNSNASRYQSSVGGANYQSGADGDDGSGYWGRASNQYAHYNYQQHQHQQQYQQQYQQQQHQQQQQQQQPHPSSLCQTPISSLDLALRPRYFAELTHERATLLDELQRHDQEARDIVARLAAADEEWASYGNNGGRAGSSDEEGMRRQCERHRGLLRRRTEFVVNRERSIMTRVGELSVEIQCRERWMQARGGRDATAAFAGPMGLVVGHGGFVQEPPPLPPSSIPHPMPYSSAALPPWPPAPAPYPPCNCKQCTRAPPQQQHQGAAPPISTGQELHPAQPSNPSYLDYNPISAGPSNKASRLDGWAEDRPPQQQNVPHEPYGEEQSAPPSEEYTVEKIISRRKSEP